MIKRRMLTGLLVISLLLPAAAAAGPVHRTGRNAEAAGDPSVPTSTVYVAQGGEGDGGSPEEPAAFGPALVQGLEAPTELVLTSDLELTEAIVIADGQDITLTDDGQARTIWVRTASDPEQKRGIGSGAFCIEQGGALTFSTSAPDDSLLVLDGAGALCAATSYSVDNGDLITCRGAFFLKGGTIRNTSCENAWSGAIVASGAEARFHMTGGVITKNTFRSQYGGTVRISHGAGFVMDGGAITGNETKPGGQINNAAVYIEANAGSSSFVMNGGRISRNHGDFGGVFLGNPTGTDGVSVARMEMNGGEISENTADRYGGGVMICGSAGMTMNDGEISGNQALIGGGIAAYDLYVSNGLGMGVPFEQWKRWCPGEFVMNGGAVCENRAVLRQEAPDAGCGGGIYIASDRAVLRAGDITGNHADRQGGGVYVGSVPYVLHMYDALITENHASILGGGLWFCPTGDADNTVTNGGAIFGNTAAADSAAGAAGDDFVSVPRQGQGHYVNLADRLLGGGEVWWYRDGGVRPNESAGGNVLGLPDDTPRYQAEEPGERITGIENHEDGIALKAVVSEAGQALARSRARLRITGNDAPRGGGVGSNGGVVIGTPEDEWTLHVTKAWDGVEEDGRKPVSIRLQIGSHMLDTVELNAGNGWTASFTQLPNPDTLGDLVITVVEEGGEYEASYSELIRDDAEKTLAITVTNRERILPGNLTVTKTVTGSRGDTEQEFPILVTLSDPEIQGVYGDMAFTDGVAALTLSHGESATARGLPAGTGYTVTETEPYGHSVSYRNAEGAIPEGGTAEAEVINNRSGGGGTASVSVTVTKEWKLDDGGTAAPSVTVRLLQDGKAWDAVELSEENGWAHTWTGLDGDRTWTVEEIAVPGFRTEVTRQGRAFTIVNDDLPEEPDDPEEPGAPDRPEDPDPQKEPAPPDPAAQMDGAQAAVPETGGRSGLLLWSAALAASGTGLCLLLILRKLRKAGGRERP